MSRHSSEDENESPSRIPRAARMSTYEPKLMQPGPPQTIHGTTSKKVPKVSKKMAQRASGYPYDLKQKRKLRKNNREKQRRSELNVKFEKLCTLLGRQAKAEKYTILTDAINLIGELRHENQELKIEKIGLRNELVSASVGPGVSEAELEKALLAAFPDAPLLPVDLSPPGSPEPGGRHLASSDDSEDDDVSCERGGIDYSSKLEGVAGLTMGSPMKSGLAPESFQGFSQQPLPPSHFSNFPNVMYKQSPGFLHPQSFPSFPPSFAPSFASHQYNPAMNFHSMMPIPLSPLDGLDGLNHMPPLVQDNPSRSSPTHLNTVLALAALNPSRPFVYPTSTDGSQSFNMDQREDPRGNTFLSF